MKSKNLKVPQNDLPDTPKRIERVLRSILRYLSEKRLLHPYIPRFRQPSAAPKPRVPALTSQRQSPNHLAWISVNEGDFELTRSIPDVMRGKYTTRVPDPANGVVLGARLNQFVWLRG